ncbi:MAG: flagellar hook capping FlgD N-terminal domain-containing protein [Pseudomonadota bacterium]
MAVSGVSGTTSTSTVSGIGGSSSQEVQDRFITLLVEQLKNQDPLNPMDNAQMTTQMSQISMVSGIQELNTTMGTLAQSLVTNQTTQAVSLIGKGVAVPGESLNLISSNGVTHAEGAFWLDSAADSATAMIKNSKGETIRNLQFTNLSAGLQNVSWDGLSDSGIAQAEGTYTLSVNALQGNDAVQAQSLEWGLVDSVQQNTSNGWSLKLNGGTTSIPVNNVKSVITAS